MFFTSFWMWLSLSVLFLIIEIISFATSGFLLCFFVGAFFTALFNYWISDDFSYCLLAFSSVTLVSVGVWYLWYKKYMQRKVTETTLNNRVQQLIGYQAILDEPIVSGRGHMVVGDTTWSITSDENYPAGTHVKVVNAKGIILHIKDV